MKKFLIFLFFAYSLASAQPVFDRTFVNNSAILNMIPDRTSQDYFDATIIAGLAYNDISQYSFIEVTKTKYIEKFGEFSPSGEINPVLVMLNNDEAMRVGRVHVLKNTPKRIEISPEYSAGTDWKTTTETFYINPVGSLYTLIINSMPGKSIFYETKNGAELSDSYAEIDANGRIKEIYRRGSYSRKRFDYQVSYLGNGHIASIEEVEEDSKGIKKVKSSVIFSWEKDDLTKFTISQNGQTIEYVLEIKSRNESGVWTEAIIYHKDLNCADGRFIDGGYTRVFTQ